MGRTGQDMQNVLSPPAMWRLMFQDSVSTCFIMPTQSSYGLIINLKGKFISTGQASQ